VRPALLVARAPVLRPTLLVAHRMVSGRSRHSCRGHIRGRDSGRCDAGRQVSDADPHEPELWVVMPPLPQRRAWRLGGGQQMVEPRSRPMAFLLLRGERSDKLRMGLFHCAAVVGMCPPLDAAGTNTFREHQHERGEWSDHRKSQRPPAERDGNRQRHGARYQCCQP
jgi:hypothetical protein